MRRALTALVALTMIVAVAPSAIGAGGKVVTVGAPFFPDDPDAQALVAELEALAPGRVDIEYMRVEVLADMVPGPAAPDILIWFLPTELLEIEEHLTDLGDVVPGGRLRRSYGSHLIELGTAGDRIVAAPIRADLKSLVWYEIEAFESYGYDIPTSFAELVALSDQMMADGHVPWCNYIESGFATGWVGTDWVEDLLLGAEGGAVYDDWVSHDVLFVDPRVEMAFERYQQMIDTAGYVFDRPNMTNQLFFLNAEPLGNRQCLMHRQGTFFGEFLDSFGFDAADFATFKFPAVDPAFAEAAVGSAGLTASIVDDRRETRWLIRKMLSPQFGTNALADAGWIMPNSNFELVNYPDDRTREWAGIVQAAIANDLFRSDGSDLMPPDVAFGTFWQGIVDLVEGAKAIPEVLADIDASWPM